MKEILHGDCLELLPQIKDKSIDMVLADLPFGTTKCKWDSTIPLNDYVIYEDVIFEDFSKFYNSSHKNYQYCMGYWIENKKLGLWSHYKRVIKDKGAILLFAQTPFDKVLGCSNLDMLRYEWIWEKTAATGHLNAKKMPMKAHENILVFYKNPPIYNPQKTQGHERKVSKAEHKVGCKESEVYNKGQKLTSYDSTERYPRSVLKFPSDKQKSNLHPTQKPLDLCKYLIKTYTNEGDVVLDNTCGSGTTGLAALELSRGFILMEKELEFFEIAKNRINL